MLPLVIPFSEFVARVFAVGFLAVMGLGTLALFCLLGTLLIGWVLGYA